MSRFAVYSETGRVLGRFAEPLPALLALRGWAQARFAVGWQGSQSIIFGKETSEMFGQIFYEAVKRMRDRQKEYFKSRSQDVLIESKKAEREIDEALKIIFPKGGDFTAEEYEAPFIHGGSDVESKVQQIRGEALLGILQKIAKKPAKRVDISIALDEGKEEKGLVKGLWRVAALLVR